MANIPDNIIQEWLDKLGHEPSKKEQTEFFNHYHKNTISFTNNLLVFTTMILKVIAKILFWVNIIVWATVWNDLRNKD